MAVIPAPQQGYTADALASWVTASILKPIADQEETEVAGNSPDGGTSLPGPTSKR